ncbi:unnamed protein product [Toxocara canis]|uniref:RRM domain-containing protein n=1 Tax=Toxocara canis TaxID=6265 RepID=A0A183TXL7_TOXCA|nr:unnamed protein product [Toxocara canis]
MRRWKGWKDGVADEEENVVMVDVHVSSKSPERVKAVDGMLDESREGSSPSVSDDLVERSSRREKRSVSPSPSDGRTAASEYLDHGDDFKEKTEELDYEEVPQQPSIDSSYENVKSEPAEGSVHVSTKKASRSSEGRLRAAIHESNETAVRNATVDGFVRERSVTPARYPVNQVLMIRQLTRPFTSKQLQQMLSTFGTIVEGGFWIDNIKSTCIVKYSSVEEAIVARGRLHNVVWPPHSPKALKVDYSDDEGVWLYLLSAVFSRILYMPFGGLARHIAYDTRASNIKAKRPSDGGRSLPEAMATSTLRVSVSVNREERSVQPASARDRTHKEREHGLKAREGATERKKAHSRSPPNRDGAPSEKRRREGRRDPSRDERKHRSSPESRAVRQEPEKSVKTADELFKKTTTQPAIYYVALTDEQVAERSKRKAAEAEMLAAKRAAAALNQRKETKSKEEKTKTTVGPEGVRHARSRSPRAARTTRRSPHSRSPRHRR